VLKSHHEIVRVAHYDQIASCDLLAPRFHP
jgi:hypothetical protein